MAAAWRERAYQFYSKKQRWGLDVDWEGDGLIRLVAKDQQYLANRDSIVRLLMNLDKALEHDDDEDEGDGLEKEAIEAQRQFLCEMVDYDKAIQMFKCAEAFTKKHALGREPDLWEVEAFVDTIPGETLRRALEISPRRAYKGNRKPPKWRADVSKVMSLAYLALAAHQGISGHDSK